MVDGESRPFSFQHTNASTPGELLDEIAKDIRAHSDDGDYLCLVGCGPLESLFHQCYDDQLWPVIEQLARSEPCFLEALSYVWASESATAERREQLLTELRPHDA